MYNKEFKDILKSLEEEFFNNVLVIKYRDREYIVSRRWEKRVSNGVLTLLVEENFTEPTPYHVGEVTVYLDEIPDDIEIKFYSKFSSRHFNSSKVTDLEFRISRQ